jgi:hypothetical protein
MNDNDIDVMLREYAPRWRAAQPPPPTARAALSAATGTTGRAPTRWRPRHWLPVLATAAAVGLVATGIGVVRNQAAPTPPGNTPSTSPGVVAWLDRPEANQEIPTTMVPLSPDPSRAENLRPCRARDLRVDRYPDGAAGNRLMILELRSVTTPCRLDGYPGVTPLDRSGRVLSVPIQRQTRAYDHPVALGGAGVGTINLFWPNGWCATPVDVATLRLALPEGGGTLTVEGFGPSNCGAGSPGEKTAIHVSSIEPVEYQQPHEQTPFDAVEAEWQGPPSVPAGGRLRFQVTLTADRDVVLDPCPDYLIFLGHVGNETKVGHALNCAGVPYRDASGRPYLPAGTPVVFAMEITAPPRPGAQEKLTWQLDLMVGSAYGPAGGVIDIT